MRRYWLAQVFLASAVVLGQPVVALGQDCAPSPFEGAFAGEVTLCQNWDAEEQQAFWFLNQGSQIIPYDWFLALEQPGSEARFSDGAHMDGFRYLPQAATEMNPDALPIGFTLGGAKGNADYAVISDRWLGMNCAACHTGQVEFDGHRMLIDGAPAMADFEGFNWALVDSMQATLDDKAKLDRFAERVLGSGELPEGREAELRQQLATVTEIRRQWNARNEGASPYGFARLDAVGAIFNEITVTALGVPENREPADAPVSYPFIWDTPHHDRVQWNGSAVNAGPGALSRNLSEVLGVFGSLTLDTYPKGTGGHVNSVDIRGLGQLEELLWKLESPRWRDTLLPAIDDRPAIQSRGKEAYDKYCVECHAVIVRDDPTRRIVADMTPIGEIGTDPKMAMNFVTRKSNSGDVMAGLRGRFKNYWPFLSRFQVFDEEAAGGELLRYSVIGTLSREMLVDPANTLEAIKVGQAPDVLAILEAAERGVFGADKDFAILSSRPAAVEMYLMAVAKGIGQLAGPPPCGDLLCYKGRPLNGIWATAPYLHNGSVRNMRQLLLPASMRDESFRVGSRTFDPNDMGFENAGGSVLDTNLPGNSKEGHEYGAEALAANEETLNALLEYLKTL